MSKTLTLKFNDIEEKLLKELIEKTGFKQSHIIRLGLRHLYKKEFPSYIFKKAKISEEKDNKWEEFKEQCEKDNGQIIEEDGKKKCFIDKEFVKIKRVYEE